MKKSAGHLCLPSLKHTKVLPKEQHIYTARSCTCKKAMAVKAKELLSFERVFEDFEIVITKSTFDKLFE